MALDFEFDLSGTYTPTEEDMEKIMDVMPYDDLCIASFSADPKKAVFEWAERNGKLPVPVS